MITPTIRWIASSLAERKDANWAGTYKTSEGKTLEDYVTAFVQVANSNGIPVCDMYHTLGFNKYNFSNYFLDTDGTHPYKGFHEIALKIESFIEANQTF